MASFYPVKKDREGPLDVSVVAGTLRAAAVKQEQVARRLAAPSTPGQLAHRALVAKENSLADVLRVAGQLASEFDSNNVATAIHKVAQHCKRESPSGGQVLETAMASAATSAAVRGDPRFQQLLSRAVPAASEWRPRQLCHAAWSLAVLSGGQSQALESICDAFAARGAAEGVPQDISTFAWALAALPCNHEAALAAAQQAAAARLEEFCPQDLAITAWAYAKLLHGGRRPLLAAIAAESLRRLPDFSGRNLANVAWSFATSQQRPLDLFEALVEQCASRTRELGAQQLPITLWAFAAAGYPADEVFEAAVEQADALDEGRAGVRHEQLLGGIAEAAARQRLEPQHLASIRGASRRLDSTGAHRTMEDWPVEGHARIIWSLAALAVGPGACQLASAIEECMPRSQGRWDPRHVAGALWAFAVLPQPHPRLAGCLLDAATQGGLETLARDGPAHLASIVSAAARLGARAHPGLTRSLSASPGELMDELVGAGGSASELSEGRQQNIAAVVRTLYDLGLAGVARAALARVQERGADPGLEAWAAWLCGAAGEGDAELEAQVWEAVAASCDGRRSTAARNAAAACALAAGRADLAASALGRIGVGSDAISVHLQARAGLRAHKPAEVGKGTVPSSPRGEYRHELQVVLKLVGSTPAGDCRQVLRAAEDCGDPEAPSVLGLGAGPRGAALDAALAAALVAGGGGAGSQPLIVLVGSCGSACAAVRAAAVLSQHGGGRVVVFEADALRAAIAIGLLEWAGLSGSARVWVGRGEQLFPRLGREFGAGSVLVLALGPQVGGS
ncbi:unnamed protein product [Prorocentrum cordatum]|uniref:Uncharacterized protein n=1 Tax=Prorocentrum cordatum TaxID=2364126 RepID=A0ABN9T1Q1_9DINO|nr:unnamed protein product [Polarella glacialis]